MELDWFTKIAGSLSGMPWWGVLIVVVLSIGCTKGVDALLRLWKAKLEQRQYEDQHEKTGYDALVEELKGRIEKLEGIVDKLGEKHEATFEALRHCEIEHERTRGELNVMKEKVARLEHRDQANQQNVDKLKALVIEEKPKTT